MLNKFDFHNLFILDLANNHQGSREHATRIIRACGEVVAAHGIRAALKFQFRDLDTFIHPDARENCTNKHVPRFLSTRLSSDDFRALTDEVRQAGLVTMATPFDETSTAFAEELGIDVLKLASCSAQDWPLIERMAETGKPMVCSTGGLTVNQVDKLVSFLEHRRVHYALMHCVAIYPTPPEKLQLGRIEAFRRRYPNRAIGFSTHEDPNELSAVQVAVAKGAELFERHVGIATGDIALNAYSSTPDQLSAWIGAWRKAEVIAAAPDEKTWPYEEETSSLDTLTRGVYARTKLPAGIMLTREDVYFAMPYVPGQLRSGLWKDDLVSSVPVDKNGPLMLSNVEMTRDAVREQIYTALHEVKAMLHEAKISVPTEFKLEISHHYGMENFRSCGAVLIDCINRTYCKKLIVQLPGQRHPNHYHKRKEETFHVMAGVLELEIDDRRKTLYAGDLAVVLPGTWHQFWTDTGVIFEEISTTHFNDDSYYEDKAINRLERSERKTVVEHWGRHQI